MSTCNGRRACTLLIAFAFAAPAPRASAQAPMRVNVAFTVVEPTIRVLLGGDIPQVETRLADVLTHRLGGRIGFVRFVPGGEEPYGLHFTIDRMDPNTTSSLVARGIRVRLIHPAEDTTAYWLTLREAGDFSGIDGADGLAHEVETLLAGADYSLIHRLLSHVPIASEALPFDDPPGWALPLGRDSLCIRDESRLRVLNVERVDPIEQTRPYEVQVLGVVVDDPGPPNQRYRGGLFGEASQPIRRGRVAAVFVIDPRPVSNCRAQPVAPPLGGGGS